ncbi:MAG TPA: GNAT family N-acetyltransferase [Solirubrobacterales bacterium]|nr:GNAT family N-acetyltransferase [Solirubrobacterales bacterium]
MASRSPAARPEEIGWEVRPARTEDVPAVAGAVAALLAELGGTPPPRAAIEAEARAHIADPSLGIVLVAAQRTAVSSQLPVNSPENCELTAGGGELVGALTASWARAIQVAGRLLAIEVLWTRRDRRDRGIGAALVEALAAAAAAEGAGRVEVGLPRESFDALRATERFYLANGFERLGPRMRRTVP